MRRVVITGIGAVTPLGNDITATWNGMLRGVSGITGITRFDPSGLPSRIAGEMKGFDSAAYIPPKDILRLDPFVHYAAAAAVMACEDAGLIDKGPAAGHRAPEIRRKPGFPEYAAVVAGSSRGGITGMDAALEKHLKKGGPFSAYLMSSSTINMAASYISIMFGTRGQALGLSTACASGTNAVGEAFRMIRHGEADLALAGGAEAPLCRLALGGYGASGSLSKRNAEPEKASRPFDRNRDGFVISEGAGMVVLEELGTALKRGAAVYAELAGYGTSSDAFHQTKPDSAGEAEAIRRALKDAGLAPDEIDYINAHATSTPLGDAAEAGAIREVFGREADNIQVSSCKSMLGHMLGAAGAVELAVTALSIREGRITPVINLEDPDPACGLRYAAEAARQDIRAAVTNSFGFGGVNAVLAVKKFSG